MNLYLIQHAKSLPKEEDPERGVTSEGVIITEKMATFLAKLKPDIHVIWHSEKKRAFETAKIMADQLGIPKRIMEHTQLKPNDSIEAIVTELRVEHRDKIIVGHLPYLAKLCSFLLCGDAQKNIVQFKNSAIVCLKNIDTEWTISWLMTPELL